MTTAQMEQTAADTQFLEAVGIQLLGETKQQTMERFVGYSEAELRAECATLVRQRDLAHFTNANLRESLKTWRMYASASIGLVVWLVLLVWFNR